MKKWDCGSNLNSAMGLAPSASPSGPPWASRGPRWVRSTAPSTSSCRGTRKTARTTFCLGPFACPLVAVMVGFRQKSILTVFETWRKLNTETSIQNIFGRYGWWQSGKFHDHRECYREGGYIRAQVILKVGLPSEGYKEHQLGFSRQPSRPMCDL